MRIYRAKDYNDLSRKAANIISAQVIMKPDAVLGLATGSSPIGTYKQLIDWYKKGDLDFSEVKTINLDEYKGLSPEDEQSYYHFMHTNLFDHINIKPENTNIPNGLEEDSEKECTRYDNVINECGGIDLQLLGIGSNGHIGFNEPGISFDKTTHCVALTENTIKANARFFTSERDVPRYAYSMGIKNIMQAKSILLIASGERKADALYESLFGPITPAVPASILQLHNNVSIVADEEALSRVLGDHDIISGGQIL
ncbi:glucosamine-6-phosphate deaminase [Butyrivibrio sp. WCD2001]|uniref:glucosamine-6-phosphate deaminase n=1 Tax=Butyrivibrio sp. WCD2001 TaxID=1280681 RepID=UPI0004166385|nr:glucosamine-6-phosphate deaminase [Butyrivibrio sp. WCD2001]